ncbi:group 1 glycosyl transferase [Neobacillus bataviensis LMG 21833]|uniref:Group 1 glycosyl transferase n=1 Tax=Neobacillus bataviensis LMG 21833 TaxID=1117379 RepID=K6DM57_9BACI|nr:glycosyltransferase [Neobacillus bataviensis]EKN69394.1 group 1 glycosyl transferase [Neobacillus bataviensis LMG 21833]
MKKKVLFMVINMNIGGTEKALLNLISTMSKHKYEISILMLERSGGFLNSIPDWVNVEYLDCYKNIRDILNNPPKTVLLDFLKRLKLIKALLFFILYLIAAVTGERSILFKYILRNYSYNNEEYDIAVAYAGPMDLISFFIAFKIKAKRKIQWIHFDITKIGFNAHFATKVYRYFDNIYAVSNEGKNKLINVLPLFKEKIETINNVLSPESLKKMAVNGDGFEDHFDGIKILTVGRLSKEKGQDLIIPVLAKLKQEGYNVRWYCIGEGNARKEYEQLIRDYGYEKDFVLLGSNPNPYPFMEQCDLYVQPSRHEGYCMTLAEAKLFNKPIVTTNFTGAKEQVVHGKTGYIVEFNGDQIFEAVKQLIIDENLRKSIQRNLQKEIKHTREEIDNVFVS